MEVQKVVVQLGSLTREEIRVFELEVVLKKVGLLSSDSVVAIF